MSINEMYSAEEIKRMRDSAGQVFSHSGERIDQHVPQDPNKTGGIQVTDCNRAVGGSSQWRDSAPRVTAPGQGTHKVTKANPQVAMVTAPSPKLQERFKEAEIQEAAKRAEELERADQEREQQAYRTEMPEILRKQDRLLASMQRKIQKLEAQIKAMGEGDGCD